MKALLCATALATLVAGQAFAQDSGNSAQHFETPLNRAPSYQQGSGQMSGGPARELIPENGVPATTGTVVVVPQGGAPVYQQGSGQISGGPARELIPAR